MSSAEYNQLLKFLYFEGYADSYEEAENLLEEMSDDEFEELLERKYDKDEKLPGSGKTPSEKMYTKRAQHGARVMLGNPALGRHPRNDPERDSYLRRATMMDRVKDAQDKGEDPRNDEGRKNLIKAARRPRMAGEKENRPGGLRANRTKAGGYRTLTRKEEFNAITEYLFVEGYVDTIESAEIMAENISAEWSNEILEAKVDWHNRDQSDVTDRVRVLRDRNKRNVDPSIPDGYRTADRRSRHELSRGKKQQKGQKTNYDNLGNMNRSRYRQQQFKRTGNDLYKG